MNKTCYLLLSKIIRKSTSLTKSIAISTNKGNDELYLESLDIILLLRKLEEQMSLDKLIANTPNCNNSNIEEINKVKRKVPKWKKNPNQYNSKILDAYFKMKNNAIPVTEKTLETYCKNTYGDNFNFLTNFSQMHNIAPKNHAKVFDIYNTEIKIWEPVIEFIEGIWINNSTESANRQNNKIKGGDIGRVVKETFDNLFSHNKLPDKEINNLLCSEYSKKVFNVNFPILKTPNIDSKTDECGCDHKSKTNQGGYQRYYKELYGNKYLLCKEWFKESKAPFIKWANKHQ